MLTRRSPKPIGLTSDAPFYSFFARMDRDDCSMIEAAQQKAKKHLGDVPSHALLLRELLRAYLEMSN